MVGVGGDQWVVTTVTLLPGDADGQPTAVVGSHSARYCHSLAGCLVLS